MQNNEAQLFGQSAANGYLLAEKLHLELVLEFKYNSSEYNTLELVLDTKELVLKLSMRNKK